MSDAFHENSLDLSLACSPVLKYAEGNRVLLSAQYSRHI